MDQESDLALHKDDRHGDIHVVPRNDLQKHWITLGCWCNPQRDDEEDSAVIHNSADGREDYETGRRKPN